MPSPVPRLGIAEIRAFNYLRENLVLAVNEHVAVMLNRYPFAAGHLLVIPRKHIAHMADLTVDENDAVHVVLRPGQASRAARSPG